MEADPLGDSRDEDSCLFRREFSESALEAWVEEGNTWKELRPLGPGCRQAGKEGWTSEGWGGG